MKKLRSGDGEWDTGPIPYLVRLTEVCSRGIPVKHRLELCLILNEQEGALKFRLYHCSKAVMALYQLPILLLGCGGVGQQFIHHVLSNKALHESLVVFPSFILEFQSNLTGF